MATSGVLGGGGYQGRYLEFAWALVSQDIAGNTSTIYWRVTVVGGSSSYYYHHRDYADAFGEVLVNSTSRTQRYKGDLKNGYKTIQHDINGYADFSAHIIAAVYTSSVNEDVSTSWALPLIPRQANITNLPASFNDEENPWFDYTNPANWELKAWLEPNPNGPHLCERTFRHTGGKYTWDLSEAERKQLRQACKGNSCTIRIGLYSNGTTWASYHDRTFIIKDPMPIAGTPTWENTNYLNLIDNKTVIKDHSTLVVRVPEATPVKEASIKQYKVIVGDKIVTKTTWGTFEIKNVNDSIIKVYVEDSRGNTVEKILNISSYKQYTPPVITTLSLERAKGGIGSNVTLKYEGNFWNENFGKLNNSLTAQYYYKTQGSGTWKQGTTSISPTIKSNTFSRELEIKGDLDANGFDASKNYDFKLVVTDKLANFGKTTILTTGKPSMAIHQEGVAFGAFYDPDVGGLLQVEGRNIENFTYSTEEQWTGDYWLDGKKIYSKVVSIPRSAFTSQTFTYNHGIINLDKCIYKYAFWDDASYLPTRIRELPSVYYGSIEWSGQILVTSSSLNFELGSLFYERVKNTTLGTYFYIIMKYTKEEMDEEEKEEAVNSDKSTLQSYYDQIKNLNQNDYTESSWENFSIALSDAKDILDNPRATQDTVDGAYKALLVAYIGLRRKS